MEEKKLPMPSFYASDLVKDAIKNAELVLFYISESGLDVDINDVKIITKAKQQLENNQWTTGIEVAFWNAYKNLTSLIHPVSVDSLKASQETIIKRPNFFQKIFKTERRETLAYRVVRFYTAFAVTTMIVMLILHIYFSIGTIRLNRIQAADENINKIQQQLSDMDMLIGNSDNISAIQKRDNLAEHLTEINIEKKKNIELLSDWVSFIDNFFFFGKKHKQTENNNSANEILSGEGMPAPPSIPEEEINKNIEIIQQAQNYVLIIGLYILPLFYGLLGALTYVLRDLSNQTKKMQYTKESNINHILRLILGTIAGLAVGVFWGDIKQQESFIVIRSLGPLIVAYLSGLTVEYIFTAIEKLVGNWLQRALSISDKN